MCFRIIPVIYVYISKAMRQRNRHNSKLLKFNHIKRSNHVVKCKENLFLSFFVKYF